jgi:hypothetical protein
VPVAAAAAAGAAHEIVEECAPTGVAVAVTVGAGFRAGPA